MGQLRRASKRGFTAAVVGMILTGIFAGGVAFAYFRTSSGGAGTAGVGSPVNVTVAAATATGDLFPGHSGRVFLTLKNTNPFTANFTSVTAASVASGDPTNCPAANVIVASLPLTVSPTISVPSGSTTGTHSISGLVTMSSSAPNKCQGVSFTVTLTLSGQTS